MIRVVIPFHLRTLAGVEGEIQLNGDGLASGSRVTLQAVLDALEERHPVLRGTIRDHGTKQRRAFVRYFACEKDWSLESPDAELPESIVTGKEPFMVVGAIAGG